MQTHTDLSPKAPAAFIKDTDEQGFEQDVLTASLQKPVLVDFWAPWCMPCKQMMPLLEKAVAAAKGAVLMVKVNIDKSPGLAQALRIQSVPTVYAFFQGKPVDGFAGAKPESEIAAFVSRLVSLSNPNAAADELGQQLKKILGEADRFFQEGKAEAAMGIYGRILDADPENAEALGGIAWCLLATGEVDAVRDMLTQLSPEQLASPRLKGIPFILGLGARVESEADIAALEKKIAQQPKDLQSLCDLALKYFASGAFERGIDALLELIRKDRAWQDKKAQVLLLEVFDALGAHPLVAPSRRKLSSVLFS